MSVKITTLVENTVTTGILPLIAEHGLSFFIDDGKKKILFDTGAGMALCGNADALGIDLSQIDDVVLSHGHFDHAGGLQPLIKRSGNFRLTAHPDLFDRKLAKVGDDYYPIGIPPEDRRTLENSGISFRFSKEPVEISDGIMTTGEIPMKTDFEEIEPMFFKGEKGKEIPDEICDDMALFIDGTQGTTVILGCSHRGVINTLNHISTLIGGKKIHTIMGGLHLMLSQEDKIKKISDAFKEFGIENIIVGHCTGFPAEAALVGYLGDKIRLNTVGHLIEC